MAYPTLPPSSTILKVSFSGLPAQYARPDGGKEQLKQDMESNLKIFGNIVDCGFVKGTTGLYAGGGYAVLAATDTSKPLSHSLNRTFRPIRYSLDPNECELIPDDDHVLVYATWASMPPYCRYCHAMDHALVDCAIRKSKMDCRLCGELGHYRNQCPRKNEDSSKAGKKRKVPSSKDPKTSPSDSDTSKTSERRKRTTITTVVVVPTTPAVTVSDSSVVPNTLDISASPSTPESSEPITIPVTTGSDAHAELTGSPNPILPPLASHHHNTRFASSPRPPAPTTSVCQHCGLTGHVRTTSKQCLKNPIYLAQVAAQQQDIEMDDSETHLQNPASQHGSPPNL